MKIFKFNKFLAEKKGQGQPNHGFHYGGDYGKHHRIADVAQVLGITLENFLIVSQTHEINFIGEIIPVRKGVGNSQNTGKEAQQEKENGSGAGKVPGIYFFSVQIHTSIFIVPIPDLSGAGPVLSGVLQWYLTLPPGSWLPCT